MAGYGPTPRHVSQGNFTLGEIGQQKAEQTRAMDFGGQRQAYKLGGNLSKVPSDYFTIWRYCMNLRIEKRKY